MFQKPDPIEVAFHRHGTTDPLRTGFGVPLNDEKAMSWDWSARRQSGRASKFGSLADKTDGAEAQWPRRGGAEPCRRLQRRQDFDQARPPSALMFQRQQ